jgi:U3 small nucleolar RNA-associated protein 14
VFFFFLVWHIQGDWVGKGGKKAKHSKKFVKKVSGVEPSKRQDAGKQNVIILEGKSTKHNGSKKLNKYQLKDLPFPYTNRHQLELNLGHSIGPEFNSRVAHRHLTRPDVLSTPGVVIQAADKPV